ncbi:MAG: hypothetical protein CME65_05495 [Halobacteriovoraceae bacterium]|nr:hypothetical protein [Halobacteriovoraceae bacterium]|tara:strand:- start:13439 stop:14440 length:1002 start_codon:yes stop_codon:yes gene_type:complete
MQGGYSHQIRNYVSTVFSVIFLVLLLVYAAYIEYFQDAKDQVSATRLLENPVSDRILRSTTSFRFKNRIGEYQIAKEKEGWLMQEPRVIPAKEETVERIFNALSKIKIHTVHQFEPINFQSFSLDKPIIEIELYTKLNEKYDVKIGLLNPINNTSYMTVSGHNRIFQTNLFEGRLEKLELSDFIESQVFSKNISEISEFKLYHGKNSSPYNEISLKGGLWQTKKYKVISEDKLKEKLSKIFEIKTHMIIDQVEPEVATLLDNYLENPLYRVEVTTTDGKKIHYKVSPLIKAVPELKLEKRQFFIMSASNRKYPYIINKNYLEDFVIRYSDLRP